MAADLGLASLSQLQKLPQSQLVQAQPLPSPDSAGYRMWNPRNMAAEEDDDDSWEIKAFEEDTSNATWPPRSYTCTFCRREFRSAQALGGHMNVHRRERARLQLTSNMPPHSSTSNSSLFFPPQELVTNARLCVLYSLPNPNGAATFSPAKTKSSASSSPRLLSINNFPATPQCRISSSIHPSVSNDNINNKNYYNGTQKREAAIVEELDLELRLGCSSSSSSP